MRPGSLHSRSAEENCPTENVSSLCSVKVATPPCAANAAIPCGGCGSGSCYDGVELYRRADFQYAHSRRVCKDGRSSRAGNDGAVKNRRIGGYLLHGVPCAHLLNRSLCVPVLANVRTRTSSSIR